MVPMLSDRFGPFNMLIPVTLIWAICAWCWLSVTSTSGYYVWTVFYGAMSASFQCLTPVAVASITPRLDKVGTRIGMAFAIISIAAMTGEFILCSTRGVCSRVSWLTKKHKGPPAGGALQTADGGSYTGAQIWAGCASLVGFASCFVARWFRAGGFDLKARC